MNIRKPCPSRRSNQRSVKSSKQTEDFNHREGTLRKMQNQKSHLLHQDQMLSQRVSTIFSLTFPKPTCDVCEMTNTMRARCQNDLRCAQIVSLHLHVEKLPQRITKFSAKAMIQDCSTDMPWWWKISFRTGSTVIQPETRAPMTRREVCKTSYRHQNNQESFTPKILRITIDPPHQSATNGTAERAVRLVNEGTASPLVYSGLSDGWEGDGGTEGEGGEAMECWCYLTIFKIHRRTNTVREAN